MSDREPHTRGGTKSLFSYLQRLRWWWFDLRHRCPSCGGPESDNWFDRSLCDCGMMHTRCKRCGHALDDCDE